MGSATRSGSIVCLLPYQFTWKPWIYSVDHHGAGLNCNIRDTHFDQVNLILKNGQKIPLNWDGCHNYVATKEGPIGRQHWRNETFKWNNISSQVVRIEMLIGTQTTCLKPS